MFLITSTLYCIENCSRIYNNIYFEVAKETRPDKNDTIYTEAKWYYLPLLTSKTF